MLKSNPLLIFFSPKEFDIKENKKDTNKGTKIRSAFEPEAVGDIVRNRIKNRLCISRYFCHLGIEGYRINKCKKALQ
ncbi:MAG TPA: hypothetical protein DCE02_02645 [Ruminiclostridium sp.]|nr:hypothetical protein [Ruminiclostridium sp.]